MSILGLFIAAVISASPPPQPVTVPAPVGIQSVYPSNTIPDGITVRGSGNATVLADEATLTLRLYGRNNTAVITQTTIHRLWTHSCERV